MVHARYAEFRVGVNCMRIITITQGDYSYNYRGKAWLWLQSHDYNYDYDYRLQSSSDSIYRLFTFSCKYTRCNQCNHMFFHASFHKYTSADANTGNMYLSHVLLAKTTVIAVITCYYRDSLVITAITLYDYNYNYWLYCFWKVDYDYDCDYSKKCNWLRLQL